ncbi:MAG: hypothetical protein OQK48_08010 [Sulfurimonas sp.]|uniref:hypothetical protein n=1 Tax=Sulfurimonas sp. TaxID=2022749 RepID=UPI0026161801|nr:hypothetical protein [Sulfurimonas sp.]MCW8895162.1 hypothetical protein [Sulfurimonas sp.]MCW8954877.1 hypothetical protein [Sulfurimonas sp.]MCW9067745.1 hypothetical protein [Sulfurimonas sp.]
MNIILKTFLSITFISTLLSASELSSENIIQKMIVAYGGENNLEKLASYEQTWDIEAKTTNKNGTDNRKVMMPDFLSTELIYPHKTEIRILAKDSATKQFGNRKIQAQGPMLDAMKLQLMRLFNPLVLKNKLKDITLHVKENSYLISLKNNTITAEYFVSKNNFLVEKVIGRLKMGSHKMEFLTIYEDYKSVDGVLVHHKEIKYAGSVNTAIMRLKDMKFIQIEENSI